MAWANFGMKMLEDLASNTSNRIGTGASLRRQMGREQVKQTQAEAAAGIVGRVEGAKAAGIHPLVAMGSNVGGASLPVGNSFNSAGGGYDFGASAMQRRELEQRREENQYNRDLAKAQHNRQARSANLADRETQARTNLLDTQRAAEIKRMADSDRDFQAAQDAQLRQEAAKSRALLTPNKEPGIPPQFRPVLDRHGRVQHIPNWDIYDNELPSLFGLGTLGLPELGANEDKSTSVKTRILNWWEALKAAERRRRANPQNLPIPVEK